VAWRWRRSPDSGARQCAANDRSHTTVGRPSRVLCRPGAKEGTPAALLRREMDQDSLALDRDRLTDSLPLPLVGSPTGCRSLPARSSGARRHRAMRLPSWHATSRTSSETCHTCARSSPRAPARVVASVRIATRSRPKSRTSHTRTSRIATTASTIRWRSASWLAPRRAPCIRPRTPTLRRCTLVALLRS